MDLIATIQQRGEILNVEGSIDKNGRLRLDLCASSLLLEDIS